MSVSGFPPSFRGRFFGPVFFAASLFCLTLAGNAAQAEMAATVEVTDGTVVVTQATGKRRIVANGSQLEAGDTITTEKDSYARIRFTDGGEMAVRPASSLLIKSYHFQEIQPSQDSLALRLIKGGIRNLTGLIGKRGNQEAYRLDGATATIGIRGTDFVARICEANCAHESKTGEVGKKTPLQPAANPVAARLFQAEGQTLITPIGGKTKPLMPGDPVYRGDTVESAAPGFAILVFSDDTRIVLNPGSRYTVTNYRYNPKAVDRGYMMTDLIKGGLRVVSGILAKRQPLTLQYNTVTATIGIRGTNFDLWCAPSGSNQAPASDPAGSGPVSCDQALYASTRDGAIEVSSGQFKLIVPKDKTAYVDAPGAIPVLLEETPGFLRDNSSPKPELLDVDSRALFGKDGSEMSQPGLYVEVKDGRVSLTQQNGSQIELNAGESGFAGPEGTELFKMGVSPSFLDLDGYLRDLYVDPVTCRAQ